MEHENMYASNNFASKGLAGTALGIAIGAGALSLGLGNGILGFGRNADSGSMPVSRYEQEQAAKIAALETEVKLRDSYIYTDNKVSARDAMYDARINALEAEINQQKVINATLGSTVACMQGKIGELMGLTKLVIPGSSICPPVTTTTTAG